MEQLKIVISYFQENWVALILLITSVLAFFKVYADAKVKLAALTPDKEDDNKAKLFKARVYIIISAIKDLFKIGGGKKGFVETKLIVAFGIGLALGLLTLFLKPHKVETKVEVKEVVKFVDVIRYVDSNKKSGNSQKIKADSLNIKPNGELSATNVDLDINSYIEERAKQLAQDRSSSIESDLKSSHVEKRSSAGLLALADFDENNKHKGYNAGAYFSYVAALVKSDSDFKYKGYNVGLHLPLP